MNSENKEAKIALAENAQKNLNFFGYQALMPKRAEIKMQNREPLSFKSLSSVLSTLGIRFASSSFARSCFEAEFITRLEKKAWTPQKLLRRKLLDKWLDSSFYYFIATTFIATFLYWAFYTKQSSVGGNDPFAAYILIDMLLVAVFCAIGCINYHTVANAEHNCSVVCCDLHDVWFENVNPELINAAVRIKQVDPSSMFRLFWFNDSDSRAIEDMQYLRVTNNSGEEWFVFPKKDKNIYQ